MRLGGLGGFEWLIILMVVIVIFGTGKLAGIGPALGKSVRGFREEMKRPTDDKTAHTDQNAAAAAPGRTDGADKGGWY